jgi:glucose-1-phosphate cytidylyltransferase
MKVVILAGGLGTRISEETDSKPKPMVLIDENPIIWHIMKIYADQGFTDFIVAAGYKGEIIEEYFANLDSAWDVSVVQTGINAQTGARIKAVTSLIKDQTFLATYGDGLGSIDISKLISFHHSHKGLATVTAVRPPARFGVLEAQNGLVTNFGEKRQSDAGWINGGFFVFQKSIFEGDISEETPLESVILPELVQKNELHAYFHHGFWQPMDTLRERNELSILAKKIPVPWNLSFEDKD